MNKETIAVDYHSTLIDSRTKEPLLPMVNLVKRSLSQGKDVVIFTAADKKTYPEIGRFCLENFGKSLRITNKKDRFMTKFYDDKAQKVEPDKGTLI